MDYKSELEKMNDILMRFDECLTVKCEKATLLKFQNHVDKTFVLKKKYETFIDDQMD